MNRERAQGDAERGAGGLQSLPPARFYRYGVAYVAFVIIRAVAWGFLLVVLAALARADTLDEAIAAVAKRISARLEAAETARITSRNISSLPAAEAARAQAAVARALSRRVRNGTSVDVQLTISENLRGYLLIAEIRREKETLVEMAEFQAGSSAAARAPFAIESKLLWEQETPMLDVAFSSDTMLVLDTAGLIRYQKSDGKWVRTGAADLRVTVRDPRGRLEINGDSVTIHEPGVTCTVTPAIASPPQCEDGGRFKAARNTQDLHDWRGEFFSSSEFGGDTLVAEADGRVHVYDAAHSQQGVIDNWGSDFAVITACGAQHIAATAGGDGAAFDSVTLYDIANGTPVPISEPFRFTGLVTALWRAGDGAVAISRNLSTGKYAAYSLTLDCGR